MIDILKNSYKLILFIIFFIICFLIYLPYNTKYPTTNDANVYADVIPVGATNNGLLNDVFVKNHMAVKKGDLLFTIASPNNVFDLNYKENILVKNLTHSNNSTLRTFFSKNNILTLKDEIYRLKQDPNSDHKLLKEKLFQLNQIRKNLVMIFYNLLAVGETLEHAELIQTNLTAIESEITLINNMVFSEIDGYISEFSLKKGALVKSYEPILGIIDDQHRYIIANYLDSVD